MEKQVRKFEFSGQKIFVGIDVRANASKLLQKTLKSPLLRCHSERSEESAQANDGNTHFAPGRIPHSVRNDSPRERGGEAAGTARPMVCPPDASGRSVATVVLFVFGKARAKDTRILKMTAANLLHTRNASKTASVGRLKHKMRRTTRRTLRVWATIATFLGLDYGGCN